MKKLAIKVCGMRERSNILEVAALQPAYMGFIFYEKTPRYVGDDFVIPAGFPATTKKVGVFVNASTETILKKVMDFGLDFVQLHGHEHPDQCRVLKDHGVGVIKVFSVGEDIDFGVTENYRTSVDYFLFDTKGKFYGGNARVFDWSVLLRYDQRVPFFLSGGITPENAGGIQLLDSLNIRAIDVNSGVEQQPALKDVEKIRKIQMILHAKPRD